MKKIYLIVIAFISGSLPLMAQQEATLHSMQSLPQAHYTNPAFMPQQQFYLGLPGVSSTYFSFSNSGFNYNSVIDRSPETDSLYINLPRLQESLGERNYLTNEVQTDILSFGVKLNARMFLSMSSTIKAQTRFMYPKGMTGLFIGGNAAYLGETVHFSPELEHISYLETALGASYIVDKKLTVGARFKYLKGIANVHTEESDFSLTTDAETYALQLSGSMNIRTAGFQELISEESDRELADYRYSDFQSSGFAVDLGATYQINSKLSVGFSALNIGFINWRTQTYEYSLDEANISFDGFDVEEIVDSAFGDDDMEAFMTELEEAFNPEEKEIANYRTGLPTQFYLSGRYELYRNLHASGLLFGQLYNGRFTSAFSAAINKDFGRILSTSLSYTAANRSYNNMGAGLSLRLTPIQIYVVSDNLISTGLMYKNAKALNMRLGMNLVFGHRKSPAKLPYPTN